MLIRPTVRGPYLRVAPVVGQWLRPVGVARGSFRAARLGRRDKRGRDQLR
jgi:hypothetical protein